MTVRVLLVTQNDQLRGYLGGRLKRAGHVVTRVSDLDAALVVLNEVAYDVLIASDESQTLEERIFIKEAQAIDPDMRVLLLQGFSATVMPRPDEDSLDADWLYPVHLGVLPERIVALSAA